MAAGRMDIAIVGAGCRLPGGIDRPAALWRRLAAGDDLVTEIPASRWNTDLYKHPRHGEPGRSYTFRAGVLDAPNDFDPAFFGISPREAEDMDPQQRVLLETAYEAIESAGWPLERLARANCAVYIGASGTEYANLRIVDPSSGDAHFMTGNALSIVANRLSYAFDLAGPSMTVDTACSSTVAALYEACSGLVEGRFDQALVGTVNLLLSPFPFLGFARAGMLSDYGQSRAFAEGASGYVRGEGAGVLALKPLAKALADGDPVRAVIRAVDLNQDGRTNGISLPSHAAQQALLQRVYPSADVDPRDLDYFEAHGTGTAVGDPIEADAIGRALGQRRDADDPLYIGSVKTNIGHLEPAAGMAGMLKAMLTLEHREIPASLHAERLNPLIPFDELNLRVATKRMPLKLRSGAGLVGVNSFGFGGLNGHVIIEGPPRRAARRRSLAPANDGAPEPAPWPLAISARDDAALKARAGDLADVLEQEPSLPLRDIAFTLWRRRSHLERRAILRAEDRPALIGRLRAFAAGDAEVAVSGGVLGPNVKTAFVFSGNGAQWAGMGQRLLAEDPAFAAGARRAADAVAAVAGWSPLDRLTEPLESIDIARTEISQPLLFTVQAGLIAALVARGLSPDATVGHSVGEIAAAYAAGALDLEQAARVIVRRSEAQAMTRGQGRMAAVAMDPVAITGRLQRFGGRVELAAANSPNAVTLAGNGDALAALVDELSAEGVDARMLDLDYAFHSRQMEAARAPLAASLSGLAPSAAAIPFFSGVTGEAIAGDMLDADYWWRNIRSPVRFQQSIEALLGSVDGAGWALIEVGPHPILQAYLRQTARGAANAARPLAAMARNADGAERVERIADEAFCLGAARNPATVGPDRGEVADLPIYPWRRQSYWYRGTDEIDGLILSKREGALLGFRARTDTPTWDAQIDVQRHPFLADHKVGDATVFPAAGFVALLLEAAQAMQGERDTGAVGLEEFEILRPLTLDDDRSSMLRVQVSTSGRAEVLARPRLLDAPWSCYARARIVRTAVPPARVDIDPPANAEEVDPADLYRFAREMGLDYGPAFRSVEALSVGDASAIAALADPLPVVGSQVIAPEQLDGAMQTLIALLMREPEMAPGDAMLPVAIDRVMARTDARAVAAQARLRRAGPRSAIADLTLLDADGAPVFTAEGARFQRVRLKERRRLQDQVYTLADRPLTAPGDVAEPASVTTAALARAAQAAVAATPVDADALRRLDRIAAQTSPTGKRAAWRRFWTSETAWSAEAALLACQIEGEAPDDARIEHLTAGGPAFAAGRAALLAAIRGRLAATSPLRQLHVLEAGEANGPWAESFRDEIAAGRIAWTVLDASPERRGRAVAVGAGAQDPSAAPEAGLFDLLLLPLALDPAAVAPLAERLAPHAHVLALAPKPRAWLDAAWRASDRPAAQTVTAWRDTFAEMGGGEKRIDCGPLDLWLAPSGRARRPTVADAAVEPKLRWAVAHGAGDRAVAGALAAALDATLLPIDAGAEPADLAARLLGLDRLAIVVGAAPDAPIAAQALDAILPALAAARLPHPPTVDVVALAAGPVAAAAQGAMMTLANEAPGLKPRTLTAPRTGLSAKAWAAVVAAQLSAERADELLTVDRYGRAAGARLQRLPLPEPEAAFKPGDLESVTWRRPRRAALSDRGLEIEVKAAGVNFRDVMFGLGLLPEEAVEAGFAGAALGMEAAGVVIRTGAAVSRFRPGDRVVCVAANCFGDRVTTLETAAAQIPDGQSFEAAATLPIVALTAFYSLASLARLQRGETVLIHGGAGGVGLAAIQYAKHVGARVIATAGSPEKRAILTLLGCDLVTDSRSLAFVDDVRRWTGGDGVDVALNSLAGDAMAATLALMKPFGRFIELGKRDFFENSEIGLKRLRQNISYFAVDADQLLQAKPALADQVFRDVEGLIATGVFQPLPYRAFPAAALGDALRWMQRAKHVGKVVVVPPPAMAARPDGLPVRRDGTYLVVGGLEGFGLETARWLARRGAGRLVLAGRRGAATPGADAVAAELKALGADVRIASLDVADRGAVARLAAQIDGKRRPLKGVVHAAAVYADGLAAEMSRAQFARALAVKADGAANLDAALRGLWAGGAGPDFFLIYSSATVVLGNPMQANYVAGNAAAEAIARTARADGLPVTAIAWGPLKATGALARQAGVEEHLERQLGRPAMAPAAALDLLDDLWTAGEAAPIVLDVDWRALSRQATGPARFDLVRPAVDAAESADFARVIAGMDEADARDVVAELLAEQVAHVLGMTPDQVDVARPVADLGLDSLMAMELKLSLEERLGLELPAMLLAEGASVTRIAERVTTMVRAGAGIGDDKARGVAERTLRRHAEALNVEALDEAISNYREDDGRARLLS